MWNSQNKLDYLFVGNSVRLLKPQSALQYYCVRRFVRPMQLGSNPIILWRELNGKTKKKGESCIALAIEQKKNIDADSNVFGIKMKPSNFKYHKWFHPQIKTCNSFKVNKFNASQWFRVTVYTNLIPLQSWSFK